MKKKIALIMSVIMLFSLFSMNMGISAQASTLYGDDGEKLTGVPHHAAFIVEGAQYYCDLGNGTEEQLEVKAPYSEKVTIEVYDENGNILPTEGFAWSVDDVEGVKIEDTGMETTVLNLEEDMCEEYFKAHCIACLKGEKYEFTLLCHNNMPQDAADTGNGSYTPVLTSARFVLPNDHSSSIGNIGENIPASGSKTTITYTLIGLDQNNVEMTNSNMSYSITQTATGVTVNQTGNDFTLTVDSTAIGGYYHITGTITDGTASVSKTIYLNLCSANHIDSIACEWDPYEEAVIIKGNTTYHYPNCNKIIAPTVGNTATYRLTITAYDANNNVYPANSYSLTLDKNYTGDCSAIDISDLGGGVFDVTFYPNATEGLGSLKYSAHTAGTSSISSTVYFCVVKEPSVLTYAGVTLSRDECPIPTKGKELVKATVKAYDQYGAEMSDPDYCYNLNYAISGAYTFTTAVNKDGNFNVNVLPQAIPGTYTLTGSVTDGLNTVYGTTDLELVTPELRLTSAELYVVNQNSKSISNFAKLFTTYKLKAVGYDQYGAVMTGLEYGDLWGDYFDDGTSYTIFSGAAGCGYISQRSDGMGNYVMIVPSLTWIRGQNEPYTWKPAWTVQVSVTQKIQNGQISFYPTTRVVIDQSGKIAFR